MHEIQILETVAINVYFTYEVQVLGTIDIDVC